MRLPFAWTVAERDRKDCEAQASVNKNLYIFRRVMQKEKIKLKRCFI